MKNIRQSLGGKGLPTYSKNKEGQMDRSHLAMGLPSKTEH